MGQRLVVDLVENGVVIAAVYYHWSAYFASTIDELANLSNAILKAEKENKNKLLSVIEMLEQEEEYRHLDGTIEKRSGGICGTPEDMKAAETLFPDYKFKAENVDRNCGIISLTKEGIDNCHDWEEGHAEINLDTHEIINDVDIDPDPFELEAEYTEEDGERYIDYYISGKVTINGRTCPIDAFDCTCETIIQLKDFMDKEYEIYRQK